MVTRTLDDTYLYNGSLLTLNNNLVVSDFGSAMTVTAEFNDADNDGLFEDGDGETGTIDGNPILSSAAGTSSVGVDLGILRFDLSSSVAVNAYETSAGTYVEYPDGDRASLLNGLASDILSTPLIGPTLSALGITNLVQYLEQNAVLTFNLNAEVAIPVCFGPDTLIGTRGGFIRAIDMQPGMEVITRDNGYQEVAWVGKKRVMAEGLFAPIRFAEGAINNALPIDLSPEHRVMVTGRRAQLLFGESEVLVAAKHLLGLPGVARSPGGPITYVHFMFEQHEVVYANGATCETFYPGDIAINACDLGQREELFSLFPELRGKARAKHIMARRCLKRYEADVLVDYMAETA